MNKKEIEKFIEYWSKHQELDKFNYNISTSSHLVFVSTMVALWIGLYRIGFWISILIAFFIILSTIYYLINTKRSNKHFMSRELMLRYWYNKHFNIKTSELDSKNFQIMKLVSCFGRNVPKKLIEAIMEEKNR